MEVKIFKQTLGVKRLAFSLLIGCATLCLPVSAQEPVGNPSAQDIIDALSPPVTRSFRNLSVRPNNQGQKDSSAEAQTDSNVSNSIDLAIQFEFNSAAVSRDSKKILETLADALASPRLAQSTFQIEGHTDSKGKASYNQTLSQARANEVKRFLTARNISKERLVALGKGSSEPLNRTDTTASENRRVRIISLEQ